MHLLQNSKGKLSNAQLRKVASKFGTSDEEIRCLLTILEGVVAGANKRHELMIDALQRLAIEVVRQHPDAEVHDRRKASPEEVAEMMPDIRI